MWFPYAALVINLIVIWFMPKRMKNKEIYVTWFVIAMINLSTDVVLSLYFHLYELNGSGIQLKVHFIEWTLGPSYGIIFLNFMPETKRKFIPYLVAWVIYSVLFEAILVNLKFINYSGWQIWYSIPYYLFAFLFLRWHIHYIRRD